MTIFEKLEEFRRKVDDVYYYKSRKGYLRRLQSHIALYHLGVDYRYRLISDFTVYSHVRLQLLDVIDVRSITNPVDIIQIRVYACVTSNLIMDDIYYTIDV